jgi:hypothetical protein
MQLAGGDSIVFFTGLQKMHFSSDTAGILHKEVQARQMLCLHLNNIRFRVEPQMLHLLILVI